jgi:hypothetical protein
VANLVIFSDFTNEVGESFINIDPLLGRSLDKLATKVSRKVAAL